MLGTWNLIRVKNHLLAISVLKHFQVNEIWKYTCNLRIHQDFSGHLYNVQCRYKLPHSLIWTNVLGILIMQKETITLCVLICLSSQANVTSQKSISIRMTEINYYISMISAGIISKNNASSKQDQGYKAPLG